MLDNRRKPQQTPNVTHFRALAKPILPEYDTFTVDELDANPAYDAFTVELTGIQPNSVI